MTENNIDVEALTQDSVEASRQNELHKIVTTSLDNLAHLVKTLSGRSASNADNGLTEDDFKLERVLRQQIRQREKAHIKTRSIGVMFRDLTVQGVDMSTQTLLTFGDILKGPFNSKGKQKKGLRNIIQNFNGIVESGEMLLVLGRPGSGCSSLLRTLAAETEGFRDVQGTISYDGVDQATMKRRYRGDLIYSEETDVHFPLLNVDQTLSFAAAIKAPAVRAGNISRSQYVKDVRDLLATVFGLTHTYSTFVGDDYVRGVSGGERKRVSIAEVIASRAQLVSWDNSTRGLDASTALEYAQAIRANTNLLKNTAIVALYQAGENIYDLFDKVTVLYFGRQIYFGPVSKAKAFFEEMGYACPPRQTTAEFLIAITDPSSRYVKPGYENRVPLTAEEFESYWRQSQMFHDLLEEIDHYDQENSKEATLSAINESIDQERSDRFKRFQSPYTSSFFTQLKLLIIRGFQRQKGDRAYLMSSLFAAVVQSLITGSLFYKIPQTFEGSFSRGGVLFFALLFYTLNSVAEMSLNFPQREIIAKQKRYSFYHPGVEALASVITRLPINMISITIFSIVLYFLTDMKQTAGQFFIFLLFVQLCAFSSYSLFSMISSLCPSLPVANAVAGVVIMVVFIYGGYLIPRPSMHPWFKWLSWLNPIAYSFESLISNEFHGRDMDCSTVLVPQGPEYENVSLDYKVCAYTGSRPASSYILGDNYIYDNFKFTFSHVWRNFGIVIGLSLFFVFMYMTGTEFIRTIKAKGDVLVFLTEKAAAENRGEVVSEDTNNSDSEKSNDQKQPAFMTMDQMNAVVKVPTEMNSSMKMNETFIWRHVNYTVTLETGDDRQLLADIQGYTKPGTLTALVGESGAGKTTLLNTLAQRINVGVITGDMAVDGKPLNSSFKRRTGYVQQQDIHMAESTVREALEFSAVLRQPSSVPKEEKIAYVDTVIKMLGMEEYADAVVGQLGEGLNVEQRKKLSVGVELAARPSLLLFLDEPTSGLDSQSAWAIVQLLRKLANAGQAIMCTIHQPSATLFEEFDKLLLLKKGGKTVYFGDIGHNSEVVVKYFESHGAPKCLSSENPAEYILNCIGAGATAVTDRDWYDVWTGSDEFKRVSEEIDNMYDELSALPSRDVDNQLTSTFAVGWFTQFEYVAIRQYRMYWRSPSYIMAKLMLLIVGGLFVGFSFWDNKRTLAGVQNTLFSVFLPVVLGVPLINQIQPVVMDVRRLYESRESASNTYHWSTMMLGLLFAEIPYNVTFSTIFYNCYYWTVNFDRSTRVAGYYYFTYCIIYTLFYTSLAIAITTFTPNAAVANIATSLLISMVLSFAGIFQPMSLIPHFWKFMYRVSPITYFIQSLLGNVLHDREVRCADSEFSIFDPPPGNTCYEYAGLFASQAGAYINNPNATSQCQYCKWTVGDQYLESVNIDYSDTRWRNVGLEFVYIVFNIAFAFFGFYIFRVYGWGFITKLKKALKRN
ncbi:ABC-2 type transporter-domain-containing protein [Dipodascopsis uninucleata]